MRWASRFYSPTKTAVFGIARRFGAASARSTAPGSWATSDLSASKPQSPRATRATQFEATDWTRISALYDALLEVQPTPVVRLNRAVAIGMAFGIESALPLVDELEREPTMRAYHLLPAVKGDLLERGGRFGEAALAFNDAAAHAPNDRDRAFLQNRARNAHALGQESARDVC